MLDPRMFVNSHGDGAAVLQVVASDVAPGSRFVPLRGAALAGRISGPLADLILTQRLAHSPARPGDRVSHPFRTGPQRKRRAADGPGLRSWRSPLRGQSPNAYLRRTRAGRADRMPACAPGARVTRS